MAGQLALRPGTLWPRIVRRTERALRVGALEPIRTAEHYVEDGGVRFVVRVVASLARKDRARAGPARERPASPFLDYEEALFVAEVSDTHVCLLNKFNVIEHHLLIVTRHFEHQETPLGLADFEALAACMARLEALGFYNAGAAAGASEAHKHLQMVPLPLAPEGPAVPIEPLLAEARSGDVPGLPFRHAFVRLEPGLMDEPLDAARVLHERYRAMLGALGLRAGEVGGAPPQSGPYNLLVTRAWMLLVPRSQEHSDSVSVNALGFAGSLFVRDVGQLGAVRRRGPMGLLRDVTLPKA